MQIKLTFLATVLTSRHTPRETAMVAFTAASSDWNISPSKVLTQTEIDAVLADLTPKARKNRQAQVKLMFFRLSVFCGLRVSEICQLNISDFRLDRERPVIQVRAEIAKGHKAREVPIYSQATLDDCRAWKSLRLAQGAGQDDAFLVSQSADAKGKRFSRQGARIRFQAACIALGRERAKSLTIHDGRHTCASMALAKQLPITRVRDMLGHSSISVTNIYAGIFQDRNAKAYNLD